MRQSHKIIISKDADKHIHKLRNHVLYYHTASKSKSVIMTSKCHNPRPQTNPLHHGEETQNTNSYTTTRTQLKQSSQLPFPQRDYYKKRTDTQYCITKQGPNTRPQRLRQSNKQYINNIRTTVLERTAAEATWALIIILLAKALS